MKAPSATERRGAWKLVSADRMVIKARAEIPGKRKAERRAERKTAAVKEMFISAFHLEFARRDDESCFVLNNLAARTLDASHHSRISEFDWS